MRRAFSVADAAHAGDLRKSGLPFIQHPLWVALIVASLGMDDLSCAAALLHDVIEDTAGKPQPVTLPRLSRQFGETLANLVDGVTKIGAIHAVTLQEEQVENLRRMLVATAKDLRVIIIKLADRLHNMRTLNVLSRPKQIGIARNTLEVYAPLAHRLGIGRVKFELEDLALYFLEPGIYLEIESKLAERRQERDKYLDEVKATIAERLVEMGIPADISGRAKHIYSIYRKMRRTGKDVADLHDLVAVRLITDSIENCYAALGAVHSLWRPCEGYFKDYISFPKPNDYRSLHTTVMGPRGWMLEVQIRTLEMHRIAEEGVAAHWRYKEGGVGKRLGADSDWLSQLSGWLSDSQNPDEFMDSLRTDLFADEIYVYTPKGELIRLPKGSTPIDFAYRIHSGLGDTFAGAKVGGRFVSHRYELKTGDTVEIIAGPRAHPSPGWLSIVKTARARAKIRRYLFQANREHLREMGRQSLAREITRAGLSPAQVFASEQFKNVVAAFSADSPDDLFVKVGFGRVATKQVLSRIVPPKVRPEKRPPAPAGAAMKVNELKDVVYRRAQCCNPMPGDPITGIVTKSRGISIHREDCPGITRFRGDPAQLLALHWDGDTAGSSAWTSTSSPTTAGTRPDLTSATFRAG
ncbi:bifunctional (p)ppGpp synthetase/guanosine-3',5'-bis(diphosphate) 3'-pyrophosphohydrolase [bacterium]|nr:bifunctional (p)ppGpp synthetase/guanosine-3',5'-bis(diphosphate) 3'-pyrophosphohydrolase [bacterium]